MCNTALCEYRKAARVCVPCLCLGRCANVAPKTRRGEPRNKEGAMGTGKRKRRRGRVKEEQQQAQRTTQSRLGREATERREGGREQPTTPHKTASGAAQRGGATSRRKRCKAKGRRGTSRDIPQHRSIYASGRSTETGFTPTLAPTSTAASATTRRGRRGGVTSRSCHRGAMTRQAEELGDALLERSGMI